MRRSGERCTCGHLIPPMVCSHCKPQRAPCPYCGETILLVYENPHAAGKEIVRRFKQNARI